MSSARKQRGLLQELERTEQALESLLIKLVDLNSALEPIEKQMRVTDFSSSGIFVQGSSRGIVCVLSGLIRGDPLEEALRNARGRGVPTLIKAGDRSESPMTVNSIVNLINAEDQKKTVEFVVNLRWSELPEPIERENTIIIGTRFSSGHSSDVEKLRITLEERGMVFLEDGGEFGGGPLVYELIKSFKDRSDYFVIEMTLSRKLADNAKYVLELLNTLANF